SSSSEKLIKSYFREISSFWDILQSPEKREVMKITLSLDEELFLLKSIKDLMALLVKLKRISAKAISSQKSLKLSLFELLLHLRDQVFTGPPDEVIPSFTFPEEVPSNEKGSILPKWFSSSKSTKEKKKVRLLLKEVKSSGLSEFSIEVIEKSLFMLNHLAHLKAEEDEKWKKDIKKWGSLQKEALSKGKEYEAKAYEICYNILTVKNTLFHTLREQSETFNIDFQAQIQNLKT
ncbi:MAG: hypothetical protein AAF655_22390, partial [Bacteroidota bacterium]